MATRMQQRRGTAAQWISTNSGNGPILSPGEIGFESDTNKFKIGDGVNHWIDLTYFTDAQSAIDSLSALVDGAPELLNTLNELAAALGDDPTFFTTVATNLSNHESDTTNVHGIADTADLATQAYVDGAVSGVTTDLTMMAGTGLEYNVATDQFDIDSTVATKTYADNVVSAHSSDTTEVHGIVDTAELATKAFTASLLTGATKSNITITGDKNGLTITAENGVADSTTDNLSEGSTNKYFTDERAQDAVGNAVTSDLTYTDSTGAIGLNYVTVGNTLLDGVSGSSYGLIGTSTYLDVKDTNGYNKEIELDIAAVESKLDTDGYITTSSTSTLTNKTLTSPVINTPTGIVKADVGLSNVDNTSDANKPVSSATQTALDLKAPIANPTFTGTVAGVTKSMVGLGSVDNTSDADKPVSSATQTELDAKLSKSGGTMTGAITLSGAPSSDLHAATKLYVDNVTAGINFHQAVHVATTDNLSADYNNGTDGVGATLTASANAAWPTIDGHTSFTQYDRILIKDQTDSRQNGIYILSDLGSGSSKWILTRASDADNNPNGEIKNGDFVLVLNGTVNASYGFVNNSATNPIVIGTDNITYTQFNAGKTVVAGNGLIETTPGTFSIDTEITQTRVSGVSDTEIGYLNDVTSSIQTQLDSKLSTSTASSTYQPIVSGVSDTEIGYLDGVTSGIQSQIDSKFAAADASTTNISEGTNLYFTNERAQDAIGNSLGSGLSYNDSTGAISVDTSTIQARVADVSDTEIGYLNGVTSAIQTQIDAKAPINSPTFTGTVDFTGATVTGISSYSAPTLGSTSITSGATVTDISNLTLADPELSKSFGDFFVAFADDTTATMAYSTNGVSWTTSSLPDITFIVKSISAFGKFFAISDTGDAYSSDNAISWTKTLTGLSSVSVAAYGNGKLIVLNNSGQSAISTNGTTWTVGTVESLNYHSLKFGGDKFIAYPYYSDSLRYSTDGITWSTTSFNSLTGHAKAAYGNGKFVVLGEPTIAEYSTDGITWTQTTLPTSGEWGHAFYGGNKFLGFIGNSVDYVYSTDAISWTAATLPNSFDRPRNIAYLNNTYVLLNSNDDRELHSTDGISWTSSTLPFLYGGSIVAGSLTSTGTLSLNGSTGTSGQVLTSTGTGLTWQSPSLYSAPTIGSTPITSGSLVSNISNLDLTSPGLSNPDLRIATGTVFLVFNQGFNTDYSYSTDAATWTTYTLPASIYVSRATYLNNKFIVLTDEGTVYHSTNGITWTLSANYIASSTGIGYGQNKYVVVGYQRKEVSTSTDLITWTINTQAMAYQESFVDVVYGNGMWVALNNDSYYNYRSTDAVTWTYENISPARLGYSIEFAAGKFVTVPYDRQDSASSTDGITWTAGSLPEYQGWNAIVYGLGKYITIAHSSTIGAYSTDGITWTQMTAPSLAYPNLSYANGKFVANAYGNSAAYTSTDGINWIAGTTSNSGGSSSSAATLYDASPLYVNGSAGTSGQVLKSTGTGVEWGSVSSYSAPTIGSTLISSGSTVTTLPGVTSINGATIPSSGTLATLAGTETLTNKILGATSTTTLSSNTATAIDTIALNSFTAIKYFVSIKQGAKVRNSEIIVSNDGTTVNHTEYAVVTVGTALTGFAITAAVSSTNAVLNITITDASTTNATIKLYKVVM